MGLFWPLFAEVPVLFTLSFGVLLSPLLLGAGRTILGTVGERIDRLTADGAALSRPFPHHVGQ